MAMVVIGASDNWGFFLQIGLIFCGIQPIVSTCMAMTKSDVKKYTINLITLSYIRDKPSSSEETRSKNTSDENEPIEEQEDEIEEANSNDENEAQIIEPSGSTTIQ
jgi:hypothetical protein